MRINKWFVAVAFSSFFSSGAAVASGPSFEDGLKALANGDFKTVLAHWVPLGQQGHVFAQHHLGLMYANGNGVLENHETAVEWLTLASGQGFAEAQYDLGGMYARGEGVPSNPKAALSLLTLSAEQGFAEAQASLGLMYYIGNGVNADYMSAYKWFSLATHNGDEIAAGLRDNVAKKMTAVQISQAQKMTNTCLQSDYSQCK